MEIIEVKQQGGIYSCDIGITKEEWLEILQDDKMPVVYKETLLRFYYYPAHRGSCTAVSNTMGGNPQSLNSYITKIGEYVQKRLGRFQVVRPNGKPCYWIIPMCEGMDLPKGSEGSFEWQLRPELVEAIREYLYWYLVERYKEVRQEIRIDDAYHDEIYKWRLITECKGKDLIEVVDRVRVTNLVYTNLISPTLDFTIKNHREDFEKVLQDLTDDQQNLTSRIFEFAQAMKTVANDPANDKQNLFANDERTASAILTCVNPGRYTIYKYDVYKSMCQYLGIETQATGHCYAHFLDLLKPLQQLTSSDTELQQLVAPSLEGLLKSEPLQAQDVLWVMFVTFPKRLGFVYPLVWRPRYWYVGFSFGGNSSQLPRFVKDGIWEGIFDKKKDKNQLQVAGRIRNGDILILKSSFTKGANHDKPCIRISAVGTVTQTNEVTEENGWCTVSCSVDYFSLLPQDFEGSKYGKYRKTIDECKDKEIIKYINEIRNMEPKSKYQKYIDLLNTNRNLILTGAPGTGKTFMAKAIAEEMETEVGFVQFHPSYDYTDFVEGLRPIQENGCKEIAFRRTDGIFKDLCCSALRNPNKTFIMIIDEINRGEISKIFGELFFSIDPGYRGEAGRVQTQYQNMIEDDDAFKEGFYVPDNVYIIGTMNDIDRSVESMDFAMRRRFAWQEVTAKESYANMIENDSEFASVKGEIKARMFNLNKTIVETEGLDEAYQIGAAYFRKYLNYQDRDNPFDCLWENHLKGLLFEYLRGNRRAKELLEKLHEAYNKTSIDEQPAHTNEG